MNLICLARAKAFLSAGSLGRSNACVGMGFLLCNEGGNWGFHHVRIGEAKKVFVLVCLCTDSICFIYDICLDGRDVKISASGPLRTAVNGETGQLAPLTSHLISFHKNTRASTTVFCRKPFLEHKNIKMDLFLITRKSQKIFRCHTVQSRALQWRYTALVTCQVI